MKLRSALSVPIITASLMIGSVIFASQANATFVVIPHVSSQQEAAKICGFSTTDFFGAANRVSYYNNCNAVGTHPVTVKVEFYEVDAAGHVVEHNTYTCVPAATLSEVARDRRGADGSFSGAHNFLATNGPTPQCP